MLYLDRRGWTVFTVEERYWLARLLLECFFWNNFADDDTYAKYDIKKETRELHTPIFGRYSSAIREAIWWKILLCSCHESIKGETAVIESGTGAIIDIIKELLFAEIELVEDLLEEDRDFALWYFTRYRILVESISRSLMKRWNEDEEEEKLSSFPQGFHWELIEVLAGPPNVIFKWRHWGTFTGAFKEHQPTGQTIEIVGISLAKVTEDLKIESVEHFFDTNKFLTQLTSGACPVSH